MTMKKILKRLLSTIFVIFGISIVAFALVRVAPGNPAKMMLPDTATEEQILAMEKQMGLDQPYVVQYVTYMKNVLHGDLGYSYKPFTADVLVSDGDIIRLDEIEFSVMHTPGHTAGSVVYFADNCMFAGDTIFEGSAGRTDFYSGDYIAQRNSLARIAALREDYLIYPGHGSSTTLKQEKKFNQFLGQSPVDFF